MIPIPLKDKPAFKTTIHCLVWLLLIFLPSLLSRNDQWDLKRTIEFSLVPMFFYATLFYFNYLYSIDHFLFKKKTAWYIVTNLLAVLLLAWIGFELRSLFFQALRTQPAPLAGSSLPHGPGNRLLSHRPPMRLFIYKDVLSLFIPVIAAFALRVSERWAKAERERAETEKENLNSELTQLKYQLQPHFFFNSLYNIYSLVDRSPVLAKEAIHGLSKMMRYMLYDAESGRVTLKEEVEFISLYISLMKLRITSKTRVHADMDLSSAEDSRIIAPLLFISLIENAFKHGISGTADSDIYFKMAINEQELIFIAENYNFPKSEQDQSGSGIGLTNLQKRLDLLYPGQHIYKTTVENNRYIAVLRINLSHQQMV